ncbi:MAG: hypothetical protein KAQ94_09170 [Arcobacteraceae bacterium]|nr:hypothetical protein [Arcobacteraceae bacterium]
MRYTTKDKAELIALLQLDHIRQTKLLKPAVVDKSFLLLLDLTKKLKPVSKITKQIHQ